MQLSKLGRSTLPAVAAIILTLALVAPAAAQDAAGTGPTEQATSEQQLRESFGKHRGYLYFCALGGSLLSQGLIEPVPGAKAVAPTPAGTGLRPSATARQQPGRAPDRR